MESRKRDPTCCIPYHFKLSGQISRHVFFFLFLFQRLTRSASIATLSNATLLVYRRYSFDFQQADENKIIRSKYSSFVENTFGDGQRQNGFSSASKNPN